MCLFYAMDVGADILYVRRRNPRVIFDSLREHRVTTMLLVPQVLDLFWSAIEREVEQQGRHGDVRAAAVASPATSPTRARRLLFRSVHAQLGGGLRLFATAGAFLPPALQQAWEDMGVIVLQGYGATETAAGSCTTMADHPLGCVGWPPEPVEMRIAEDGEIQFRGPTLFKGYWNNPEATAAAYTEDGWYKSGDLGQLDEKGRLHLHGRKKDIIVLPNGFNVYPEDLENALRVAGIRDSVALETRPGRIEAIVLGPGGGPGRQRGHARAGADRRRAGDDRRRAQGGQRRPSARASGSPAGACGPRRTSRGPTRSRSSATRSAPGRPTRRPLPVTEGAMASG